MQIGQISLVRLQSSDRDWTERRERRSGYRRRREDETLEHGCSAPPSAAPSLGFLAQVAAQSLPAQTAPKGAYQAPRWRCGVCADERA